MPGQTLHRGAPGLWQLLTDLVADGSVTLAADSGTEILLRTTDAPALTDLGLHLYLLPPSLYCRTEGVRCHILPVFDNPGVYPASNDVYAGYVRDYVAGPPATARTSLRIRNLSAASVDVAYRIYAWKGLI